MAGLVCEQDGTPSSTRFMLIGLGGVVSYALIRIINHVVNISDPILLGPMAVSPASPVGSNGHFCIHAVWFE